MEDMPGVRTGQFEGLDAWLVETGHASAAISVFGGQLLSWRPQGQAEVLWLSPTRKALPTPIRGGTPVCWPYFGRQGQSDDVPAHGHVRTQCWILLGAGQDGQGNVLLSLKPSLEDASGLALRMELVIGATLQQRLITHNVGSRTCQLTQALHNYFRVGDVGDVRVAGVDGLLYRDNYAAGACFEQQGDWLLDDPRDPGRADRIYASTQGSYILRDPRMGRAIALHTSGSRSVVVWSPGQATAAAMADVGPAWRQYLCVETANAGEDVITLCPGQMHELSQTMQVGPI